MLDSLIFVVIYLDDWYT